jgi:hypothetical protein
MKPRIFYRKPLFVFGGFTDIPERLLPDWFTGRFADWLLTGHEV